jgi:predicted O-linked N-acetylglucosamine transferase (SPINDLY family)
LRNHAVAYFFEPLLEHHDRSRFELVAYASVEHADAVSQRMREHFDSWHNVFGMSDEAVAARIRDDGIDVLVDLAGHTAGNRLGVFALGPAAAQLTYLGYPDTTGLAAMDARVTDLRCDPPGSEPFHTERLLHVATGMHVVDGAYAIGDCATVVQTALRDRIAELWHEADKNGNGALELFARVFTGPEFAPILAAKAQNVFAAFGREIEAVHAEYTSPAGQ